MLIDYEAVYQGGVEFELHDLEPMFVVNMKRKPSRTQEVSEVN